MKYAWPESSGGAWDHAYGSPASLTSDQFVFSVNKPADQRLNDSKHFFFTHKSTDLLAASLFKML
jgi:hypothetical protein